MSETIKIPNHIPISWLTRQKTLDDESLFLVSVPNQNTETGYISRFIKFGDLKETLGIHQTRTNFAAAQKPVNLKIEDIQEKQSFDSAICCEIAPNPYIISAIYQENGGVIGVDGYRLSSAMSCVFESVEFENIKCKNIENYNLVESTINDENILIVNNNAINYSTINSDFSLEENKDCFNKSRNRFLNFKLFVVCEKKCTMDLKKLKFETIVQENSKTAICQLEKDKKYLFDFQQIDPKTLYVSRKVLKNIEVSE